MGMGHYERLLIHHLMQATDRGDWRFGITFSGRSGGQALNPSTLEPGLQSANYLGLAVERLAQMPWPLVRGYMRFAGMSSPDLYHSLSLSFPPPGDRLAVYTIHDLPPARFPDEGRIPVWAKQAVCEAKAIMTPSQFAKNELMELLGLPDERVHVIPYGCEHEVFHSGVIPADAETLAKHNLHGPFLFYAGGFTRRKNVAALLEAWKQIEANHPEMNLALAGPEAPLRAIAASVGASRVVVLGHMQHSVMRSILKAAVALVCPSIYEGFGLPPQEAMALGVPVVAVRAGAIPEVVGSAAVLAPDGAPDSLAQAMQVVLKNGDLAQRLRTLGLEQVQKFSWQQHAASVLNLYQQVLAS